MAGYPYYSPPPPSPPSNDTTPTLPPPPPPPACNHTTSPTLSPLKSPPPPAQSHYSHPPHSVSPASPPPSPPPPPSSYYSPPFSPAPPKSLQPPSSPQPSPPPYSSYPHYSPPPHSSTCNTTTPTLQTPPPPPACTCNKTTPTSPSPPPPSSYYSPPLASLSPPPPPSTRYFPPLHSPPPPSHSPPPSPACNETTPTLPPPSPPLPCNTTSPTVSPPTFPSLSPPPPQHLPPPPSPYYSPPQPSLSPPPPPSPTPPLPLSPPPHSFSSPPPPPPSIAPPTYPPNKLPLPSPPPPSVPTPCHCVCPSPWAPPPNYYPSIAPNYYPSISPSPQFLSPSNGHRTVVLTTFVSLGGVFFLAFITIGLLSMAIKKRISMPTTGQHDNSHVEGQDVQNFERIPTSTSVDHSVIDIGPDQKPVPPDQGDGHVAKEGDDIEKVDDSNNKLRTKSDAPQEEEHEPNEDEEKSDEPNRKPLGDQSVPDNTAQDVEQESNAVEDESKDSKKKLRPRKKNPSKGRKDKKGETKSCKLASQAMKAATIFHPDGEQEFQDDDNGEEEVQDSPQDEDHESNADEEDSNELNRKPLSDQSMADNSTQDVEQESNEDEEKSDEPNRKPLGDQSVPDNTAQDVEQESNAVEDESKDSKKKLRPRKKNPSKGRKDKKGETKSCKLASQAMKAATIFHPDGEQESQDDDNGEEEVQDSPQDEDHESNADEEESNERNRKPLGDQSMADNSTQDVEQESNAVEDESKKRLRPRKKNPSNGRKVKQGETKPSKLPGQAMKAEFTFDPYGEQESQVDDDDEELQDSPQDAEHESNADEEESNELNHKPPGDPSMADNSTQDVEQESNAVEDESKKKLRTRKKNPSNSRKDKQGETKPSKLPGLAMKAAFTFDPYREQESQVDDDDEEELQDSPQDAAQESNTVEDESNERSRKPLKNQTETDNIDAAQDVEQVSYAVEEESNDSKAQLRPRKKTSSACKVKQGEKQVSKLGKAGKAVINFYPDGEQEYQDDESNAEAQQVPQDAEDESNANEEKSDEHNHKPFRGQSVTDIKDISQDVDQESSAVQGKSNPRMKNPSSGRKGKQGGKKPSDVSQAMKAAISVVDQDGELESQDDDNDEGEVLDAQDAEHESNANEDESDEGNSKPVSNQSETDNIDTAEDVEQESSAVEKESINSKERLRPHKKSPSIGLKGKQGERKSSKLGQLVKGAVNVDLNRAVQPQDYDYDEAEEEQSYRGRKELPNLGQIVSVTSGHNSGKELVSFGNPDDKEEESEAYSSNQDLHRHKRHTITQGRKESSNLCKKFSATIGSDQGVVLKSLNVGQILTAPIPGDPGVYLKSLADEDEKEENDDLVNKCDDPSMECESFVDDNVKKEESKSFGSKNVSHLQKRQTGTQRRKEAPDVGQTSTAPIGGDVVDLKSLADDYEKEENEDPSIECDDPNMEYELLVDDDAKEEKSDSFGSKKDSRLHKRQIGARGRRDPRNVGQIWSDPLGDDPSTYFESLADDDEKEEKEDQGRDCDDSSMEFESLVDDGAKEEESESFGLKKVTRLQKRQIGGRGSKGPPNVGQILNIPTGGDAGVDLKFLADEQKKLELFGPKEVSRLHKRQTGAGGRKEPPNLGQIWTATTGSDPGVGLKSVDTQVWASNIGESMTVRNDDDPYGKLESHDDDGEGDPCVTGTNEGDPNAGLEFHEEDEELESECSNKGLGLHKPHALSLGETEPSTDDQSVFVTGDDDPDESGKVARSGKPLSRPRTTGVRGKRRT